jgi:hypothetical protein
VLKAMHAGASFTEELPLPLDFEFKSFGLKITLSQLPFQTGNLFFQRNELVFNGTV